MCGRFASTLPAALIARAFGVEGELPAWEGADSIAPAQAAPVVRHHPQSGQRRLDLLVFGLRPHFWKAGEHQPFNARGETVARLGLFAGAFAQRRCLVPASAWYEWRQEGAAKQPYAVSLADTGQIMALGGIWEGYRAPGGAVTRSFAIITMPAAGALASLHARMPLVLAAVDWGRWLQGDAREASALLQSADAGRFAIRPADPAINRAGGRGKVAGDRGGVAASVGNAGPGPADLFGA